MGFLSILGVMSPAHMTMMTWLGGARRVGSDGYGNRYYRAPLAESAQSPGRRERRWVIYNGAPEASKVPPEWHGWLHYQTDAVPEAAVAPFRRAWQKPHQPNLTDTNRAYRPPGHVLSGGRRDAATGDYEAWTPDSQK